MVQIRTSMFVTLVVSCALAKAAHAERPRAIASFDAPSLVQRGVAAAAGVELGRWQLSLALGSHDLWQRQFALASDNAGMYATMPIAVELVARYRTALGIVAGARAGVVHLHFSRTGVSGIDEEFDYGVTPFVGYEWSPIERVFVAPWLGALVTVVRQTHGELPMDETAPRYSTWPAKLRGGIVVGVRY
jgi:hypothetical protein